jgi:hypothetical protein
VLHDCAPVLCGHPPQVRRAVPVQMG